MKTNDKDKHEAVSRIAGRGLVLVGLLAMVLSTTIVSRAQSSAATAASAAKAPAAVATPAAAPARTSPEAAVKPPAKGQHEGIAVHGHWTIVVKNPDGKVVSRQEFENALDPIEGADLLTGILSGEYETQGFFVELFSLNGTICQGAVFPGGASGGYCLFLDGRNQSLSSSLPGYGSLAYTPNSGTSNNNGIGFTLTGTVGIPSSATPTATIGSVMSGIAACTAANAALSAVGTYGTNVANATATTNFTTYPPAIGFCPGPYTQSFTQFLALTSTNVSQSVSAGQTVTVSVVITFGSGS
jgi:hypothetical protein